VVHGPLQREREGLFLILSFIIPMEHSGEYTKTWDLMVNVEEAFSQVSMLIWLTEELQKAVNDGDKQEIIDTTAALTAVLPVFTEAFDKRYRAAFDYIVKESYNIL